MTASSVPERGSVFFRFYREVPMSLDKLLESSEFTNCLFRNFPSVIIIVDKNLRVTKVNDTFRSLFRKDEYDALNQLCGDALGCCFSIEEGKPCGTSSRCRDCSIRECVIKTFISKDKVLFPVIRRRFYIGGNVVEKKFRIKSKHFNYNSEDLVILEIEDFTREEEEKKLLREVANRDFLTNLYNRRSFFELGEKIYENAKRKNLRMALVMIDIDYFKTINDNYGHETGDYILVSLSNILVNNLRTADIVARMGGEEFCILLNGKKRPDAIAAVEKIREIIENSTFRYKGFNISVTISCGITLSLENSLEEMIETADNMLYRAKGSGRNRTIINDRKVDHS